MSKRASIFTLVFTALIFLFGISVSADTVSSDSASAYLQQKGILQGDERGNLMLDKDLTREEMIVIMSRLLGQEEEALSYTMGAMTFKDVPHDHWAAQYIAWAEKKSITKGHNIDTFGLGESLTVWQAEAFLVRALGYNPTDEAVETTSNTLGIADDGLKSSANLPISRGQMAVLVYNALHSKTFGGDELGNKLGLNYTFGFADSTGRFLIIPNTGQNAQSLNCAVGDGGKVYPVKYFRYQPFSDKDTGRDTAINFDNREGYIFQVTNGTAIPDKTYLLTDDNFLNNKTKLTSKPLKGAADKNTLKRIEEHRGRMVIKTEGIAQLDDSSKLYLVQFNTEEGNALASLVLVKGDRLIFMDYPAKYDEYSTWRVDDGGTINAGAFDVLFALKDSSGKIQLGITWAAPEGENSSLLEEDTLAGDEFKESKVIKGGRYMAPM